MNKRYEVLEVCLNEIEQGVSIDDLFSRYPEFADDLRPVLDASVQAQDMAVPEPSQEIVKRNRAKLLQHAAELRETQATGWTWSLPLQRAFVSLVVLLVFLFSGTGLVRAASMSLPGDGLYPVKRAWERVLLFTAFDAQERDAMQLENESERLDEINEILLLGRSTGVDFSGYVTRQNGDEWRVSGITVFISSRTDLPDQSIQTGMAVHVTGQTQNGVGVTADRIEILPLNSKLPKIEDETEQDENKVPDVEATPIVDEEAGNNSGVPIPMPVIDPREETIDGVVKVLQNNYMVVNGVIIDMRFAEIKGSPRVGVVARAEGYYGTDGIFIALEIEFKGVGSNSGDNPANNNSNNNGNTNNNSNDNDNSGNDNHNDNNSNEPDVD